ncbi:hypothetical protein C8R45DRAFT_1017531, partial [Mycena sanguinolenta]
MISLILFLFTRVSSSNLFQQLAQCVTHYTAVTDASKSLSSRLSFMPPLTSDLCPVCRTQYLQFPKESTGYHCPANQGRIYQACGNNDFEDNRGCSGFIWCSPREPGQIDNMHPTRPSSPTFSQDQTDGRLALTPSPRRKASLPCSNHCGQPGNATCVRKFCRDCCLQTNVRCPAPRHNSQPPPVEHIPGHLTAPANQAIPLSQPDQLVAHPEQPFITPRPYAKPISPTYAAKLQRGDFTVATVYDRAQAESYRIMAERQFKCYWFTKDNEPPKIFMCTIPNPPANFFHPKDDPAITTVVGKEHCNPYTVLLDHDWVTTSTAQCVRPGDILCFRSLDVTVCVGGPFAKRRLSGGSEASPSKISRHSSPDSISANRRKSTATQVIDVSSDEDERPASSSQINASPTKKSFPSKWACDMNQGFVAMDNSTTKGTVLEKYAIIFVGYADFVSSTYYKHKSAWEIIQGDEAKKAQLDKAIKIGRSPGGEWKPFC